MILDDLIAMLRAERRETEPLYQTADRVWEREAVNLDVGEWEPLQVVGQKFVKREGVPAEYALRLRAPSEEGWSTAKLGFMALAAERFMNEDA
jgi:hypothetical protein